jgi:hypothetical protein
LPWSTCERLLGQDSGFLFDLLRLKGEILNVLGRHARGATRLPAGAGNNASVPWARMGLAIALRGQQHSEAETLGQALIDDFPEFMPPTIFSPKYAKKWASSRKPRKCCSGAARSRPTTRRDKGWSAMWRRNHDFQTAEKAYGKVLERRRGSSLRDIDDYTNLSRVMLERGHTSKRPKRSPTNFAVTGGAAARRICRTGHGRPVRHKEGDLAKARQASGEALAPARGVEGGGEDGTVSQKLALDLAHACLATGNEDSAATCCARWPPKTMKTAP